VGVGGSREARSRLKDSQHLMGGGPEVRSPTGAMNAAQLNRKLSTSVSIQRACRPNLLPRGIPTAGCCAL
jgi:hypothetical protein